MKTEIEKIYTVWEETHIPSSKPVDLRNSEFNQIASSIYSAGPSYYYVVDFYDMSLSHISASIKDIHGLTPSEVTFNSILSLIHPDDMDFVARAEAKLIDIFQHKVGVLNFTKYKTSYSFRFRTAGGKYKLFLHQALVLTIDEKGAVSKALNIHTDISHITSVNNYTVSFIGLQGQASFMEIPVGSTVSKQHSYGISFTKREEQVIKMLAEGMMNAEIAERLKVALNTVKNHRQNIMKKAGVKTSAELIKKCMLLGLV